MNLGAVFEQHHSQVFRAAYRITGNAADAEDVLQTVFLNLMRRNGGRGEVDVRDRASYLVRAAVNGAIDVLRSRSRLVDTEDEPASDAGGREQPSVETEAWHAQRRARLRTALAGLAPRSAKIVALRYFEGYGNVEIAALLGTSPSAVAVALHRARRRLAADLAGEDLEEQP
jgi:RNA polymerase sigma-70 factor (ECF subfamily)